MTTNKGFGKANLLIERERARARIRHMPPDYDQAKLSDADWCYLAMDLGVMVGVFIEEKIPVFQRVGAHFNREDDGTVTGVAFLKHLPTDENVWLVLEQSSPGAAEYSVTEVGPLSSGPSAISLNDLQEAGAIAESVLNRPALAYSFLFEGENKGEQAGYAFRLEHIREKVEAATPEGCTAVMPVAVSSHGTTIKALLFAHCLNKQADILFDGWSYGEIEELLAEPEWA